MPKFEVNRRTMRVEPVRHSPPSKARLLAALKRAHARTVRELGATDAMLDDLVARVVRGTRNIHYLGIGELGKDPATLKRVQDLAYWLLREIDRPHD